MNREYGWKNIVAGAIGGLAASYVMNRYISLWSLGQKKIEEASKSQGERAVEEGSETLEWMQNRKRQEQTSDPATLKLAEKASKKVLHMELNERQKKVAEPIVHYTFGTLMGAWYGALAEATPIATKGMGLPYGAVVWLGADEIAVPVLKLSEGPTKYPASSHLRALSAHLVYGITTDLVRRGMLKAIGGGQRRRHSMFGRAYQQLRRIA